MRAEELAMQPEVWERGRIGLPLSAQIAELLRRAGEPVPAKFMTAEEAADCLDERIRRRDKHTEAEPAADSAMGSEKRSSNAVNATRAPSQGQERSPRLVGLPQQPGPGRRRLIMALDPRAKWLFYCCLSILLLAQSNWLGVGAGALLTVGLMLLCHVTWRQMMPILRPFLWFAIVSIVFSGLRFGGEYGEEQTVPGLSFSAASALTTSMELSKLICVVAAGIVLSTVTTPLAMKKGIERLLSPLARIAKLAPLAEAISLAASLLLRFIPVLRREAARFNKIANSRGKRTRRSGAMRLRDFPAMTVPLLLSLLQLASDLSLALEARGYALSGSRRTSAVQLHLKRADWLCIAAGAMLLVVWALQLWLL
jgi:energy-coupling factor transport system ATP-binding protein